MSKHHATRRRFLQTSAALAAGSLAPYWISSSRALDVEAKNDRPIFGCIGTGDRWGVNSKKGFAGLGGVTVAHGDVVAVCDVDGNRVQRAKHFVGGKADTYDDYRKLLDRKDIEAVVIATPDHWHTKIAIDALRAGKDVYCEKPLTLTIDEGKQICRVAKETGRVFQVGTQQRSEMDLRFLTAVALVKEGRLGKIKKVTCAIGGAPVSDTLLPMPVPKELNWDAWLGQSPWAEYTKNRCHYEFRWWYEYSGGKMTDWGAHHVDIATWAIGADQSGPVSLEGWEKFPGKPNAYNTATAFDILCRYGDGTELEIRHDTENGIKFEGDKGRIFVSRGALKGKPVEELKDHPLPEDALIKLYKGKKPGDHMRNFVECLKTRETPISDVFTHHRAMTTCHLANICIRLGRPLKWDPQTEQIVGDVEAQSWQARAQRKGYEITV